MPEVVEATPDYSFVRLASAIRPYSFDVPFRRHRDIPSPDVHTFLSDVVLPAADLLLESPSTMTDAQLDERAQQLTSLGEPHSVQRVTYRVQLALVNAEKANRATAAGETFDIEAAVFRPIETAFELATTAYFYHWDLKEHLRVCITCNPAMRALLTDPANAERIAGIFATWIEPPQAGPAIV